MNLSQMADVEDDVDRMNDALVAMVREVVKKRVLHILVGKCIKGSIISGEIEKYELQDKKERD